jgi:hypothetical protein
VPRDRDRERFRAACCAVFHDCLLVVGCQHSRSMVANPVQICA